MPIPPGTDAAPATSGRALAHPDRRQLTSMFCDIVGSTSIAEKLDAEDFRAILLAYRDFCATIVRRNQGEMARYVGDGILAHFGFPMAREDDARLAVKTGLEICARISELSQVAQAQHGVTLSIRIGIDTGIVVTDWSEWGSAGQGGAADGVGAVGSTLNIAARLQALAPPNCVVIGPHTLRLVQGQFIIKTLGPVMLRGLSREIIAYQVLESSSARSLFEARLMAGLSPLIGRRAPLEALHHEWSLARRAGPRTVLVAGEPGIGKSRLVHEFQKQVEPETVVQITCICLSQYQGTALHPVKTELERVFSVIAGEPWPALLDKVTAAMRRLGLMDPLTSERLAQLLAEPQAQETGSLPPSPDQRLQVLDAVTAYVAAVAARIPLLLIFEDLHWADPSTLGLLGHLRRALRGSPVLILASVRAEAGVEIASDTRIDLERITPSECRTLIGVTASRRSLPPAIVEELVQRSDGVPLFVEELTKTVEEGLEARSRGWDSKDINDLTNIPSSLHDSLMARLDRLGDAKAIAQVASAIGRTFRFDLISAVLEIASATLRTELNRLVDNGLIFERFPEVSGVKELAFEFKHELVRNVAYESMLRSTKREIHGRIADIFQSRFPEEADRHPELSAHHYSEAGLAVRAIPLWELAGRRAIRNSANLEAVAHLTHALTLLNRTPSGRERSRKELELHLALAAPLMAAKGYSAPELGEHLTRSMVLSNEVGDASKMMPLIYGRWSLLQVKGQLPAARKLADQLVMMAERLPELEPRMIAYRLQGTSLQATGHPAEAVPFLQRALALFEPALHTPLAYQYGADIQVMTLCSSALARWTLGQGRGANRDMVRAWARAEALEHDTTRYYCAGYRLAFWAIAGRIEGFEVALLQHGRLLEREMPPVWLSTFGSYQGWLRLQAGDPAGAVAPLRACVKAMDEIKLVLWQATALMWLGAALGLSGQPAEAETAFQRGHDIMLRSGERWAEPELLRLWACMRADTGQPGAQTLFVTAQQVSAEQGAAAFTLRTAIEIVRRAPRSRPNDVAVQALADALAAMPEPDGPDADTAQRILFDIRNGSFHSPP